MKTHNMTTIPENLIVALEIASHRGEYELIILSTLDHDMGESCNSRHRKWAIE
jgi:hypothetical protein